MSWKDVNGSFIRLIVLAAATSSCAWTPLGAQDIRPARLQATRGFTWLPDSTEHFNIYIEEGTAAAKRRGVVVFQLEESRRRVLRVLGQEDYPTRINVFIVGSRERMNRLVKRKTNGIAFHRTHTIALVSTTDWSASPTHELLHVLAMNAWGVGPVWLNEGLAVYADRKWHDQDLHATARYLLEHRALVPIDRMIRKFRDVDELVAYPEAGSFVKYVFDTYGREAVHALWLEDVPGFTKIAAKELRNVEQDWLEAIRGTPTIANYPAYDRTHTPTRTRTRLLIRESVRPLVR